MKTVVELMCQHACLQTSSVLVWKLTVLVCCLASSCKRPSITLQVRQAQPPEVKLCCLHAVHCDTNMQWRMLSMRFGIGQEFLVIAGFNCRRTRRL